MKIKVRRACPLDVDAIAGLELLCFPHPWSRDSIEADILGDGHAIYYVAEDENEVIAGYMGAWTVFPEININNVAVHPGCRRAGVGDSILAKFIDETELLGFETYNLEVRQSNLPAKNLYLKHGFKPNGLRKAYYEDNHEDAVLMSRQSHRYIEDK